MILFETTLNEPEYNEQVSEKREKLVKYKAREFFETIALANESLPDTLSDLSDNLFNEGE